MRGPKAFGVSNSHRLSVLRGLPSITSRIQPRDGTESKCMLVEPKNSSQYLPRNRAAKTAQSRKEAKSIPFEIEPFLDAVGVVKTVKTLRRNQVIFVQGDPDRDVFYIRKGRGKRTVVSRSGKEAVVGILGAGDFFGEWCLSEQPVCIATASAMEPTTLLMISKEEMLRALHAEHALSDGFIAHLLGKTVRIEEKLVDQLFNSAEKRLARALLRL